MQVSALRYADGAWSEAFPALDSPQTLVIAFAAPGYSDKPAVLRELVAAYPTSIVIGCSTAGEIVQAQVVDHAISVAVIKFENTRIRHAIAETSHSNDAGVRIADALAADDLRAVFVLSEGLGVNGSELARGINARLPARVSITGGLAGDGTRFGQTWVLANGEVRHNTVVAVGLYGDAIRVTNASRGGWDAFGPERLVTGAKGNVLHTLDGRPALALYKEYLGDRAAGLPSSALLFPLALRSVSDGTVVVRTVLSVDEATQTMTFAGDIPTGHYARLMRANFDRLVLGAERAAQSAAEHHSGPALVLAVSCVGRRLVLRERIDEEIEATLEAFAAGSIQLGFYSYGELSPHDTGRCGLHNQTMTLTALSEG